MLRERILDHVRQRGVVRPRDFAAEPGARVYLRRMVADGTLASPQRGLYTLAEAEPDLHQSLIEVCTKVPDGVICLLSALRYHGLTTQMPHEVWVAIGSKARTPRLEYPSLRVMRFGVAALHQGAESHLIGASQVRVFTPAKAVADCFKYRNKIGLDVAIEALRDCWHQRRATVAELRRAAEVCRVAGVMQPYLESVT